MGRPRKPSHLHVVEGAARPDRSNPNEPKPKRGIPRVPAHLSPKAKTVFRNIAKELNCLGIQTALDAMRSDAWKRTKAMMAKFGITHATRPNISIREPEEVDPLEAYQNRWKQNRLAKEKRTKDRGDLITLLKLKRRDCLK